MGIKIEKITNKTMYKKATMLIITLLLNACSMIPIEDGKSFNAKTCFKTQSPDIIECRMYNSTVDGGLIFHNVYYRDGGVRPD